jgi:hypothetical protein
MQVANLEKCEQHPKRRVDSNRGVIESENTKSRRVSLYACLSAMGLSTIESGHRRISSIQCSIVSSYQQHNIFPENKYKVDSCIHRCFCTLYKSRGVWTPCTSSCIVSNSGRHVYMKKLLNVSPVLTTVRRCGEHVPWNPPGKLPETVNLVAPLPWPLV